MVKSSLPSLWVYPLHAIQVAPLSSVEMDSHVQKERIARHLSK